MLVLTRRLGETIHIGDDVIITVVSISKSEVRIGVTAPLSLGISRPDDVPRRTNDFDDDDEDDL